jgi:UDP-N-acetylmuramoylalanine--D-glutamate ligase
MDLKGKNILVLGLGESGLACARWCSRHGAHVRVIDTREQPPQLQALKYDVPNAVYKASPNLCDNINGIDIVVRSPGLAPGELLDLEKRCRERGIAWLAELDLFMNALQALSQEQGYRPKLVAVTGTNGKTTVTRLCGALAERAGVKVAVAGNISPAMLDELVRRLDANDLPELWAIELSSFQLHGVEGFAPTAATVLNVTQDHLDWHGLMEQYAQDKARVYGLAGSGTVCVVNRDDDYSRRLVPEKSSVLSASYRCRRQHSSDAHTQAPQTRAGP